MKAETEKELGYKSGDLFIKSLDDNSIRNIDASLRRIADTLDLQKQYDKQFVELSKAKDEIIRLNRELSDAKSDRDKMESKASYFEGLYEQVRVLLKPVEQREGMDCTRGYERGCCPAADAISDVQEVLETKGGGK